MSAPTRNDTIWFAQWCTRLCQMNSAQPNEYLPHVSRPGSKLWKHLCQMWAGSLNHNENFSIRVLQSRNRLAGTWQCGGMLANIGPLQLQPIHAKKRTVTGARYGLTRWSYNFGSSLGSCGNIATWFYMTLNLKPPTRFRMPKSMMRSQSCMQTLTTMMSPTDGTSNYPML